MSQIDGTPLAFKVSKFLCILQEENRSGREHSGKFIIGNHLEWLKLRHRKSRGRFDIASLEEPALAQIIFS